MQGAVIRMKGDRELTQAIADGMTGVELRRAQEELARLALELTEMRAELKRYEQLEAEAEKLRVENAHLRVEVEMLRYQESKYVREKVERLKELSRVNRPAPLCVRLWIGLNTAWEMIRNK